MKQNDDFKKDVPGVIAELSHLGKSFGENHVLKDINLSINKGENLVVIGKSGTGKSVLIKCMVGLIPPDKGKIKILDENILQMNNSHLNALRKKTGFLFQSSALYDSMTVRENLEFPLRYSEIKSRGEVNSLVEEALENVGLGDTIDKMPSELSGGMRKRLGLARSLMLKPRIMMYDEPTTGLDPVTSREISELILSIQSKYSTSSIIITHDLSCAKITSNRIVVLKDGVFISEGTYDELKHSNDKWIQSFFQ